MAAHVVQLAEGRHEERILDPLALCLALRCLTRVTGRAQLSAVKNMIITMTSGEGADVLTSAEWPRNLCPAEETKGKKPPCSSCARRNESIPSQPPRVEAPLVTAVRLGLWETVQTMAQKGFGGGVLEGPRLVELQHALMYAALGGSTRGIDSLLSALTASQPPPTVAEALRPAVTAALGMEPQAVTGLGRRNLGFRVKTDNSRRRVIIDGGIDAPAALPDAREAVLVELLARVGPETAEETRTWLTAACKGGFWRACGGIIEGAARKNVLPLASAVVGSLILNEKEDLLPLLLEKKNVVTPDDLPTDPWGDDGGDDPVPPSYKQVSRALALAVSDTRTRVLAPCARAETEKHRVNKMSKRVWFRSH
jgi:hypothetical protein